MKTYNYFKAVKEDVLNYIQENEITITEENREEVEEQLNEDCWMSDSVTGNASGSYTFSTWQAQENLCHNWDLLAEVLQEFGCDIDYIKRGAEACDVTIRCYLLSQCIAGAIDEILS